MRNFFKGFLGIALAPLTMGLSLGLTGTALGRGVSTVGGIAKDTNSLKGLSEKGSTVAASHLEGMADRTAQSRADREANESWDSDNRSIGGGRDWIPPQYAGLGRQEEERSTFRQPVKQEKSPAQKGQLIDATRRFVSAAINKYGGA